MKGRVRRDHFPSQLSDGEQQRIAMARAIAKRPDVFLCDEPTGALDYETGKVVLEAIPQINAELGTITVVITRNAAIAGMAGRVLRLADGRIVTVARRVPEPALFRLARGRGRGSKHGASTTIRAASQHLRAPETKRACHPRSERCPAANGAIL
jgi:ABC-type sulfate/molybdate transport systems ATPase subunit